jgi:hypothetical protein
MWFVEHPTRFWMFHDCHDELAEWLEELECSVSWAPIRARLRVAGNPARPDVARVQDRQAGPRTGN